MSALDFLLNLAAVLLWEGWRWARLGPLVWQTPTSLVGTLRPSQSAPSRGWLFALGLAALLVLRAIIYCKIGSPADWIPKLNLGVIVLAFRNDSFPPVNSLGTVLVFSFLAFVRALAVFYFWLLTLGLINRRAPDPISRAIRLHLGRIGRWPWPVLPVLPLVLVAGCWVALHPLLVWIDVMARTQSLPHLFEQGLLVGAQLFMTLKFLLPVFLFLHLISTYVYLGNGVFWEFVANTARNLLVPLRWLPLRFARLDFAPIAGVALLFLLLQWLPDVAAAELAKRGLTLWPQ